MDINTWLKSSGERLKLAGIQTANLDCVLLLAHVLNKEKAWLYAHGEDVLSAEQINQLDALISRRISHEPMAYIVGRQEFFGRDFIVNSHTLTPRPETEMMIEMLLESIGKEQMAVGSRINIVDVGTGSGCLAITAYLELTTNYQLPTINFFGTDIDPVCIETAKENADKLGAKVKFLTGDLLSPLSSHLSPLTYVLANLPYVPDSYELNQAATHEPKTAIFGGADGLDYYRQLFAQIDAMVLKPIDIFTESLLDQHDALTKLAAEHDYKLVATRDLIQHFTLAK